MRKLFVAIIVTMGLFGVAHANSATGSNKAEVVQTKETKVNINTASAQQIAKLLNGVGIKKAEAIVAYRTQNGPFKSSADLMKVKGLGTATLQKNASLIVFN